MNRTNLATDEEEASIESFEEIENYENVAEKEKANNRIIYHAAKRLLDIVIGIIGLIVLIPTAAIVIIMRIINKETQGPLFYEQLRIGKNGKYFRLYKFRSMLVGADKKLKEYLENNPDANEEFKKFHKLNNDPRITKTGKFLRKTSLDELPQVINLINGTMSVVGPRPVIDEELKNYEDEKEKFLSVKPGLTGYWQVNGRSNTTYDERMQMELYYVDNCSLWLDIKIFFKTFAVVLKKEGAM